MNIFDVVGPVMVGPSSSHTAGAVKIGYISRKLLGEQPDSFAVKKEVTYDTHFHNSTMSVMRKEEIAQFIQSLSA